MRQFQKFLGQGVPKFPCYKLERHACCSQCGLPLVQREDSGFEYLRGSRVGRCPNHFTFTWYDVEMTNESRRRMFQKIGEALED